MILAFERGDGEEREFWRRAMEGGDLHEGDLERAIAILRRHGAIEATTARAARFAEEAHQALSIYPDGEMRRALAQAVDFAVERNR